MTATADRLASRHPSKQPRAGAPLPVRERRPKYVALAIALIVGFAALGAWLYNQAGKKTPVVIVTRHVAAGHPITRSDLSTAEVAGDVTALAATRIPTLVGQTATVDLLPNTLLQRAMLSSVPGLRNGFAHVGVGVKPGQMPAGGLSAGDTVEVLQLPSKDAPIDTTSAQAATVLVDEATVYASTADPSQSGGAIMTLVVPRNLVPAVATASNTSLIALVQVSK